MSDYNDIINMNKTVEAIEQIVEDNRNKNMMLEDSVYIIKRLFNESAAYKKELMGIKQELIDAYEIIGKHSTLNETTKKLLGDRMEELKREIK